MPVPRRVARFNKVALNKVTVRIAPIAPGFGVLTHRGRKSGHLFRTPVNLFPKPDRIVIALTYGTDSDWFRNVQAAGECDIRTRGRDIHLVNPRLVHDETRTEIRPLLVRGILRLLKVSDFLVLDRAPQLQT